MLVPKRVASRASSACWRWPSVRMPSAASRSAVFGPMPGTRLVGAVAKRTHASSRPIATNPAGLPRSLQHLATSRDGPTPTEITIPVCSFTAAITSRSTRSGLSTPVRSAYASSMPDLLHAVEPLADELPHALGRLAVGREVRRDDDRVRAQPARARGRHRRADAELARLVARGRHHRARSAAGDDHRLARQLRPPQQLDGRVERVAVEVGDDALGPGHNAQAYARRRTGLARREDRARGRGSAACWRSPP